MCPAHCHLSLAIFRAMSITPGLLEIFTIEMVQSHEPESKRRGEEDAAQHHLPLAGGVLELGEGLTEGHAVQRLLLFTTE